MVAGWRFFPVTSIAAVAAFVAASGTAAVVLDGIDAVFGTLLAAAVVFIAVVDLERFEIPDLGCVAILLCGLAWTVETSEFKTEAFAEALLRTLVAAGLFYGVRTLYRVLRGFEGLGLGDVKLAGAGASWLSGPNMATALFVAVGAAIIVIIGRSVLAKERISSTAAIPFGAFLAPAIWIGWFLQVVGA